MMLQRVLVFATLFAITTSIDLERIQAPQKPVKNFDVDRYGGYWYSQARYIQCGWFGSASFSNLQHNLGPARNGRTYPVNTYWRDQGVCTNSVSFATETSPGQFLVKDAIGNLYSGDWVVLATDYKTYAVSYGCVKPSVTGRTCEDPYIVGDTREPNPSPYVLKKIEMVLRKRFGLLLNDLVTVKQDEPCIPPVPSPKREYNYLKKKY